MCSTFIFFPDLTSIRRQHNLFKMVQQIVQSLYPSDLQQTINLYFPPNWTSCYLSYLYRF